jgi:lipopolysaccharide transport system permease protein
MNAVDTPASPDGSPTAAPAPTASGGGRRFRDLFVRPFTFLWQHRDLIWAMAQRDIAVPYAGQMLGSVWALGHPLFLVALLAIVFNFLFGSRFGGTFALPLDYTVFLLSGLVPWQTIAAVLGVAGTEITSNDNLVKQVVFPVEVLPIKGVITSLVTLGVGLLFLVVYVVFKTGSLPWTYVLLPIVVLLHILFMFGVALAISALGVFFRDVKDIMRLFVTAGIYVLPVIYIPRSLPGVLRPFIYLNPPSYMVWCYQDTLYFGRFEHPWAWPVFVALSLGAFFGGFAAFQKLKPFFGNVL